YCNSYQARTPADKRRLKPPERTKRKQRGSSHLRQRQSFERYRGRIVPNRHDVRGEGPRTNQGQQVATANRETRLGKAEQREACRGATDADKLEKPRPGSIDERGHQRYQGNREPGDETGFGGRGEPQAEGLEGIAAEEEAAGEEAGKQLSPGRPQSRGK